MPKAFSWNTYSMSNLYAENFTGKSIVDQPRSFATFGLLLFVLSTRNFEIFRLYFIPKKFYSKKNQK